MVLRIHCSSKIQLVVLGQSLSWEAKGFQDTFFSRKFRVWKGSAKFGSLEEVGETRTGDEWRCKKGHQALQG